VQPLGWSLVWDAGRAEKCDVSHSGYPIFSLFDV
jgi:hypothetical protein